jgi:hypothetical protein
MATWFEITFTGEPTDADFQRVSELAAGGFTSCQLLNGEPAAGQPVSGETVGIGRVHGTYAGPADAAGYAHIDNDGTRYTVPAATLRYEGGAS